MIFNINNAGMKTNAVYNQTNKILSKSVKKSTLNKNNSAVFKSVIRPSFSVSSSNNNVNYNRIKQTKNG